MTAHFHLVSQIVGLFISKILFQPVTDLNVLYLNLYSDHQNLMASNRVLNVFIPHFIHNLNSTTDIAKKTVLNIMFNTALL